jgi:hypothetical protein
VAPPGPGRRRFATVVICAGLVVGGTLGLAMACGTLLLLAVAVGVGIFAYIVTDEDDERR